MSDTITGGRSPGFPYINLEKAVERLTTMYAFAKRSKVKLEPLYKHWEISPKSASSKKTIAAMKYFGLIEDEGRGADRAVLVSQRGLRILLEHEGSARKKQELKDAALSPAMYHYLWEKYGDDMPHDDAIKSDLIFEKGFNESSVSGFLNDYKKTINYASLSLDDKINAENDQKNDQYENIKEIPKIDDTVQWTSQGVDMFVDPKVVTSIDDTGEWLFVDGEKTGIPMSEATVVENNSLGGQMPPPNVPPVNPSFRGEVSIEEPLLGMKQDTFNINEGKIILQFPVEMSAESFEDFTDWLLIQHRKIARTVKGDHKPKLERKDQDAKPSFL